MSLLTNWGYTITGADELPDLVEDYEFYEFSAGKYAGDQRTAREISAASSAIRNYCGWHVYPPQACEVCIPMNDRRVTRVGTDLLIQLPAKYVSAVSNVEINDVAVTAYTLETNGLLRLYDISPLGLHRYTPIDIAYTAGLPDGLMGGVKELVAHRVTHALASSNGITTEQVGGVSVTYNANWINSAQASSLQDGNKETLEPYRLQGVF